MSVTIYLKYRDTRPSPVLTLYNPDGTAYDLTGNQGVWMNIELSDGTAIQKTMTVVDATAGTVRRDWVAADWNAGGLVASPVAPLGRNVTDHKFEIEVVDTSGERISFPNDGNYTLHIADDLGQGTP